MKLIRDIKQFDYIEQNLIVTIGNFDGLHLGHQEIINSVVKRARELNMLSCLVTFDPHPLKILTPKTCPKLITTFHEKMHLIEKQRIDILFCTRFTQRYAQQDPEGFVKNILYDKLKTTEIFVGKNYRFGKQKTGDIKHLKDFGLKYGFKVNIIESVYRDNKMINSTNIRRLVENNRLTEVSSYLGRPFTIEGKVTKGQSIGRRLGFPTANLIFDYKLIPSSGVYAVKIIYDNKEYLGVANVGFRPSFGKNKLGIEVHIFDFKADIYHKYLQIQFIEHIREEILFEKKSDLIKQIKKDIIIAEGILKQTK